MKSKLRECKNPKMQSLFQCKGGTSHCGAEIFRVSCISVQGRQWKLAELRGYLAPWYRVCTSAIYIKWKLRKCRTQKCNPCIGAKAVLPITGQKNFGFQASPNRADNENLRNFGSTLRHGTVFALRQDIHQEEATGMKNPKMQSLFWCKGGTSDYGAANFRVSSIAVYGRHWKLAELRGYLAPWYHVCTKSIYTSKGSYGNVEPKNAILVLVQRRYFPLRSGKLSGFIYLRIGPRMKICGTSWVPCAMVPCLH